MSNKNTNKYKRPLNFIWESFKGHQRMFYLFLIGKIIEGIFYVLFPIFAKLEMDQLVEKNEQLFGIIELTSFNIFLVILAIIFGFKLIENFLKGFISIFEHDYTKLYENLYSESLYKKLESLDPGLFLNSRNKKFIGEVIDNSNNIGYSIRELFGSFIKNIFTIIGIVGVLIYINIWIIVILFIASIIIYYIEKIKEKINQKNEYENKYQYQHKMRILKAQMRDKLTYLIGSGGFDMVYSFYGKYNQELREKINKNQKQNFILNIISFITENVSNIGVKIIVGFGIYFSTTSIGTMTMVLMYSDRINELFNFFRTIKFDLDRLKDNLEKLDLLLDISKINKNKNKNLTDIRKIEFINTNFKYPNFAKEELKYLEILERRILSYTDNSSYIKDELYMIKEAREELKQENPIILEDINLVFEKGKTYGLVGKNGAGKTTLISLIMNFFNNYSGNIKIDNIEIKEIKRDFFKNNISIIDQVPYIINGFSIRENLLLGVNKKYNDEYIFELLEKFGIKKKILKHRKGLDAEIGYGNDFSGGEKTIISNY
ncbi:MAG: ABC transporter ATP-binding protein [Candidatus Gracilibacteria bacterium]|nr:ABC transporter ATP-binding protein [Candidatus Gracilibacteria bacterium]